MSSMGRFGKTRGLLAVFLIMVLAVGCGKKGPPMVPSEEAVEQLDNR